MIQTPFYLAAAYALVAFLTCDPHAPPSVNFRFADKAPIFSSTRTTRELRLMAPSVTGIDLSHFPVTSGLTQGKIETETSISFESQQLLSGDYCLWPQEVDVTVHYQAQVYIAKQYPPDSCRFALTRQHELRHVAADEETLAEYLPKLKETAIRTAAQAFPAGPFTRAARDQARDAILEAVKDALAGEMDRLDRARQQRQQAIDTAQEYMRLSRACPGEPIQ